MDEFRNHTSARSGTERAEAFSDAIIAIIITLLVLELHPPQVESGRLSIGLLQQWPTYLAYLTSYLYIAIVWLNHKAAFQRIHSMNRGLHWANFGVLFTVALLPFPTQVVAAAIQDGNPADARTAVALYALIGAVMCLSWLVFFHYLSQNRDLVEEDVDEGYFPAERVKALTGAILYVAGGLLGYLIAPPVALVIFLILPIFYGITSEGLYTLSPAARRSVSRR